MSGDPVPDTRHVPVLPAEVLALLDPGPGQFWVDATLGAGGHTRLLAERVGPGGLVLAVEQDASLMEATRARLAGLPVRFHRGNFAELPAILAAEGLGLADGVLADLGVCSDQLDDPEYGLSFQADGPLDMRLDAERGTTAADLVNRLPERELADLIFEYGEERHSRRIARRIVETRQRTPFRTTGDLAALVRSCVPRGKGPQRIDPATRVFQALRIAVNDEMGTLEQFLKRLPDCVKPGGRAGVIAFHSLEDRRAKTAFKDATIWEVVTRKPVTAGEDEERANPRSRSARLRVAVRKPSADGSNGEGRT
jgi:16S rRNA (cytosine1402-N4)-methyltransferase